MADQEVGLRIKTDGQEAVQTIGNIKKELRAAQQEAVALSQRFGETSKEALDAAKKAALLKDQIDDTKEKIALFDPGAKFQVFGNAIRTVAGGFSALTGAVALFGVESKEVEKTLLKVQSALAITEGLNTIVDAGKDFQRLGAIITQTALAQKVYAAATVATTVVSKALGLSTIATAASFKVLRTAIITTGIGALLVGVGFLINKIQDWTDSTEGQEKAQQDLKDATDALNRSLDNELAAIDRVTKISLAQARARGASAKELIALERKGLEEARIAASAKVFAAKSEIDDLTELRKKEQAAKDALLLFDLKQQEDALPKKVEIKRRELKSLQEIEDEANAERQKRNDALNAEQDAKNKVGGAGGAVKNAVELRKEEVEAQLAIEEDFTNRNISLVARGAATIAGINKEASDKNIASLQAEKAARDIVTDSAVAGLGLLSDLVGRSTAAGKVLALAEIAAGTAVGFVNALRIAQQTAAATGPGAAFAFPIFYATQLTAVLGAAARAKQVLQGGGNATGTSAPQVAGSVSAPQIPRQNITGQTSLDQNSLNQIGNATARAYVLESDVSGSQQRITRLNRAASLN